MLSGIIVPYRVLRVRRQFDAQADLLSRQFGTIRIFAIRVGNRSPAQRLLPLLKKILSLLLAAVLKDR
jgi:hypothetical protein